MNIKTYIVIAVTALTAACCQEPQNVEVPTVEATAQVELNDDGSVKTTVEVPADEAAAASVAAPVGQQHQL